ncbi:MAG: acyl-CoA dehydrogenase family protein [Deltaproteobacteria bacterium]|nr:acyl-CoA dehydrogenase family protein [Deltaproteobacteria bacterium]
MISFEPTEDQKMMIESVASFARTTLRPRVREFEKARAIPAEVRKTAHELGLGLVALPESVGGAGLGMTTLVLLEEEIANGDPAAAFGFGGPGALGFAVTELGTAAQATAALSIFTSDDGHTKFGAVAWGEEKPNKDRAGLSTTATKTSDGWRLDGTKAYVVNADRADRFVVFAQVDASAGWRGVGAFVVDKGTSGLTVLARDTTLGLDVASFGGLRLDGVVVKEDARLLGNGDFDAALVRFFARQALVVAARGVGLSRAAFDLTREYVDNRKAFGKPIGHFQAVAFTVADRAMDVDAGRALLWRASAAWDAYDAAPSDDANAAKAKARLERDALLASAHAIAYAHEAAMRCGDDGVQLHGGNGFIRDYLVEKLMRDAKQLGLCAMTAEHADQLAGIVTLGLPIDPGVVLPTAETQSAFV